MIERRDWLWKWKFSWKMNLYSWEQESLLDMLHLINNAQITTNIADS